MNHLGMPFFEGTPFFGWSKKETKRKTHSFYGFPKKEFDTAIWFFLAEATRDGGLVVFGDIQSRPL